MIIFMQPIYEAWRANQHCSQLVFVSPADRKSRHSESTAVRAESLFPSQHEGVSSSASCCGSGSIRRDSRKGDCCNQIVHLCKWRNILYYIIISFLLQDADVKNAALCNPPQPWRDLWQSCYLKHRHTKSVRSPTHTSALCYSTHTSKLSTAIWCKCLFSTKLQSWDHWQLELCMTKHLDWIRKRSGQFPSTNSDR